MNFLMPRFNIQAAAHELQSVKETKREASYVSKAATAMEGLSAIETGLESVSSESHDAQSDGNGDENGTTDFSSETNLSQVNSHTDVTEDNGFLIIPKKEIPDNWMDAPDILSFRSLDRSFVFPGEQIRILACLSTYKQDTEIITPFKIAAIMNKNGIRKSPTKQNGNLGEDTSPDSPTVSNGDHDNQHGKVVMKGMINSRKDVSSGESLLRMEEHKRQTEELLNRFQTSHFFARIAESTEPLWSRRRAQEADLEFSGAFEDNLTGESSETASTEEKKRSINAVIDRGMFDGQTSGGLTRGSVECCSLSNGDIVVLLEVNVGVEFIRDPILEILQFEKWRERKVATANLDTPALHRDPCSELLKWLLPLDNSVPPPGRPLSSPTLSSSSTIQSTPAKPTVSGASGSQIFSLSNFRSYSMPSYQQNLTPPSIVTTPNDKPMFELEDWNQFSSRKFVENETSGNEGLLSFRGMPLQQERFSVQCGLEGIFTPGRRWRRKFELIQPVEIHSYSVDCNTDDLLCVTVKNVTPKHAPDVVVFVDAITIIFEEASKGGPPLYLPIACIDAGNNFTLPNLALRRGEEHSFILKPAATLWKHPKGHTDSSLKPSRLPVGNASSIWHQPANINGEHTGSSADRYAVLVSCRCNYTESKLFFKHPTSWRPRAARDLIISVASEMSKGSLGSDGTQLPVQVLTLQASNMTSDNLTLTVLAPASFTAPPSVIPLSGSLPSIFDSTELAQHGSTFRQGAVVQGLSSASLHNGQKLKDGSPAVSINTKTTPVADVPNSGLGCSHLWIQSRVPLGCVPSHSTANVKLEVLPLTDGIITLDSLQIEVKEKGLTYIPEQSLKIHATSSIATGIS